MLMTLSSKSSWGLRWGLIVLLVFHFLTDTSVVFMLHASKALMTDKIY